MAGMAKYDPKPIPKPCDRCKNLHRFVSDWSSWREARPVEAYCRLTANPFVFTNQTTGEKTNHVGYSRCSQILTLKPEVCVFEEIEA